MTQPVPPDMQPQAAPVQPVQVSMGLADTPQGQRLAVSITLLLGAAEAREWLKGLEALTGAMSQSGRLVVAGPGTVLNGNGSAP